MDKIIKREHYLERIRPFYNSELIKVLIDIRRCGKSVLLRQIIEEIAAQGIKEERIIYLNFEDFAFSGLRTAQALYDYIKEKRVNEDKYYLFLMRYRWLRDLKWLSIHSVRHGM